MQIFELQETGLCALFLSAGRAVYIVNIMANESVWLKWWHYDGNNEELRAVLGRVPFGTN